MGASYAVSQLAGERLALATRGMATFINANSSKEVVMGPSTTMMLKVLSICLGQTFTSGDEIIVTNCDHESNIGAWFALEKQGMKVK
ncbi:MAG: aminotransferase class V-fold PLP-dependent enzyme, partial [Nostoc sp.]